MNRRQFLETGIGAGAGVATGAFASTAPADTSAGSLRAGVAKSDITTDAKGVVINDPLYAKALVLDDGTTKAAIIAMDTCSIGGRTVSQLILDDVADDFLPKLRSRIQ